MIYVPYLLHKVYNIIFLGEQVYNDAVNQYKERIKDTVSLEQYIESEEKAWSNLVQHYDGDVQQQRGKWQVLSICYKKNIQPFYFLWLYVFWYLRLRIH